MSLPVSVQMVSDAFDVQSMSASIQNGEWIVDKAVRKEFIAFGGVGAVLWLISEGKTLGLVEKEYGFPVRILQVFANTDEALRIAIGRAVQMRSGAIAEKEFELLSQTESIASNGKELIEKVMNTNEDSEWASIKMKQGVLKGQMENLAAVREMTAAVKDTLIAQQEMALREREVNVKERAAIGSKPEMDDPDSPLARLTNALTRLAPKQEK